VGFSITAELRVLKWNSNGKVKEDL